MSHCTATCAHCNEFVLPSLYDAIYRANPTIGQKWTVRRTKTLEDGQVMTAEIIFAGTELECAAFFDGHFGQMMICPPGKVSWQQHLNDAKKVLNDEMSRDKIQLVRTALLHAQVNGVFRKDQLDTVQELLKLFNPHPDEPTSLQEEKEPGA